MRRTQEHVGKGKATARAGGAPQVIAGVAPGLRTGQPDNVLHLNWQHSLRERVLAAHRSTILSAWPRAAVETELVSCPRWLLTTAPSRVAAQNQRFRAARVSKRHPGQYVRPSEPHPILVQPAHSEPPKRTIKRQTWLC